MMSVIKIHRGSVAVSINVPTGVNIMESIQRPKIMKKPTTNISANTPIIPDDSEFLLEVFDEYE